MQRAEIIEDEWKRTPPEVSTRLVYGTDIESLAVEIAFNNLIPIEYSYLIVTKNNRIVSSIMTAREKIHPASDKKKFYSRTHVNGDRVIDDYIELRFRYNSIWLNEIHDPKLSKEQVTSYRLEHGVPQPLQAGEATKK